MSTLSQQLLDLLKQWHPAPGTGPDAIAGMLRAQAASVILGDPAQAILPPGDIDPIVSEAIRAGAQKAAAIKASGGSLRLAFEHVPAVGANDNVAEQPTEVFGPFFIDTGFMGRFVTFESSSFRTVTERIGGGGGVPITDGELWFLIPDKSTPDSPDNLSWTLPAGTVWIQSRFLLAAAVGFTGLRIASGKLQFNINPSVHGLLLPQPGTVWTLEVVPEPPPPADAGQSDAGAISLQLPATLQIHSNKSPEIAGTLSLSGFGSDLHLTPSGSVFPDTNQLCFGLRAAESQWSIAGNRSQLTQFVGECLPDRPRWTLPITTIPPEKLGEAAHGGSIVISPGNGLTSVFAAQGGTPFRWSVATLTMNAARLEIQSLVPDSGARYDLGLWGTSISELRFAGLPLTRLIFRSEKSGFESVAALGGSCRNKWDLPCSADGLPFPFAGTIEEFGFVTTTLGPLLNLLAAAPASTELSGFALENVYVVVRPLRRVALLALCPQTPILAAGSTLLQFDVNVALPILPDPYAANLEPPASGGTVEGALRLTLAWADNQAPVVAVTYLGTVPFPEQRVSQLLDDTDELAVHGTFKSHLQSATESLYLLDLSSNEHLFGVALESPASVGPQVIDNRLAVPLNRVRLLLQPQVQWEPVLDDPDPEAGVAPAGVVHSFLEGGPSLVGANSVKLVPVLAAGLSEEIAGAIKDGLPAAALFSLPFGLRAMANLDFRPHFVVEGFEPATFTVLNEPALGGFRSARQLRLFATGFGRQIAPSLAMPGILRQLLNLDDNSALRSVLPSDIRDDLNSVFAGGIPLGHADLSGYGLSTFSEWHRNASPGQGPQITKVEFRVLNGRTAYEVIQSRSTLYDCGARVVRTVVLERHNSGRVIRKDSGWVPVDDGLFNLPIPFQKGALKSFRNIRRIRLTGAAPISLGGGGQVEPVIFDADAEIDGAAGLVPIYDRPGYVQTVPPPGPNGEQLPVQDLTAAQLKVLFEQVHGIHGAVDCAVRLGGTLDVQISSIDSDVALDDNGGIGFAVALMGTAKLPRAGQWTIVKVDPRSQTVSHVDPHRGVPFVRNLPDPFRFREASDARLKDKSPGVEYALMMATESSRALFEQPNFDPDKPGTLTFDVPPLLADPYSLVQSSGIFPGRSAVLQAKETSFFEISKDNLWRLDKANFNVEAPSEDFLKGGGWGLTRVYQDAPQIALDIDSAKEAAFNLAAPVSSLNLSLPGLPAEILKIQTTYQTVAGGSPQLGTPTLVFSGALDALTEILDSLQHLINLELPVHISVEPRIGPIPSFIVHLDLQFGLGDGPDGRIEIGIGKFRGRFELKADLDATLTGVESALLSLDFQGDVQQGIIPPLLYAGGLFRFKIELGTSGPPVIQISLGITISVGGDLIPGLIALEATLNEGYSLVPATLEPGVLLGVEARAKLLGGLIGFSFSAEVMASVKRPDDKPGFVTIAAQIKIAATVHIAIFLDEDVHFDAQFHQDLPLVAVATILSPEAALIVSPEAIPL